MQVGGMIIQWDMFGCEMGWQVGEFILQWQYDVVDCLQCQMVGFCVVFDVLLVNFVEVLQSLMCQYFCYDVVGQLIQIDIDVDSFVYMYDVCGQVIVVDSVWQFVEYYVYDVFWNIVVYGCRGFVD